MVATKEKELEIQQTEEEDEEELQPQDIRYDIAAYPTDFTVRVMHQKWEDGQIVIPDFQRRYVWNLPQASRLIESFLLGLPVPQIFLYRERTSSKLLVVDGQQRLATIVKFYNGQFDDKRVFRLRGIDQRWAGKTYNELSEDDRQHLDDCTLRAIVIQQLTPDDNSSVYQIFERLNTSGTQLNAMEIRKAMYHKQAYDFIESLNKNLQWREIIGLPTAEPRLRDVELVLRVLALAHSEYYKPMKQFLTDYMESVEEAELEHLKGLKENFTRACSKTIDSLGERPFRIGTRLNVAILDAVMATAVRDPESLLPDLKPAFDELIESPTFRDSINDHTSDVDKVNSRLDVAREHLLS